MYIGKIFINNGIAYFKTEDKEIYKFFWQGESLSIDDSLLKSFVDLDLVSFSGIKMNYAFNALRRK